MFENKRALVVMYHYVREYPESSPGGIRPLFTGEFETQLDWLEENFQVVPPDDFLSSLKDNFRTARKPKCLLTFDDGTRDHLEVVAPILRRRSLSGVFSVLSWPSELQRMTVVHALHWALGLPEDRVWAKIRDFAETHLGGEQVLGSLEDAKRTYPIEPDLRALIKNAVNFVMPLDASEQVMAEIAEAEGKPLNQLANEWFLSEPDLTQLDSWGMEVGIHGGSHQSLNLLGANGMKDEIIHCSSYLRDLLGKSPTWFCHPFGGADATLQDLAIVHQACREVDVSAILTTRKARVTPETSVYEIPRFDCIDLPPRSDEVLEARYQSE